MSKISTYSLADTPLQLSDRLIGTEAPRTPPTATPLATKNFSLGELLQLFSSNFPAATLQAVLDEGNVATQDMFITGEIVATLIRPTNIEDVLGSQGTTFQFLSKATTGISWIDLPVDNLQAVLNAGNTATQNINLTGNITSTKIIPGNIQDYTTSIGTTGQVLTKSTSGIVWSNLPISTIPSLNEVLLSGNTSLTDAKIGALYLYDDVLMGYGGSQLSDNVFSTYTKDGNPIFSADPTGYYGFYNGLIEANLVFDSITAFRQYQFPDTSGTIALTSDIPAAITLTTTGTSGPSTLIGSVLNIPNYATSGAQDLNDVLTIGNTSLLNANVGELGLWDNANAGYMPISAVDNSFVFKDSTADKILAMEQGVFSLFKDNIIAANLYPTLLTTARNFDFPDASGTIALTSDLTGFVTSVGATGPITSSGGTTPTISTSMSTNKIIGRSTAGTGVMEEISVGTGLTLSGGTLSATATGGGIPHTTASGTDTYTATVTGVTSYADGDAYLVQFTNGNTTGCTLNINGLGAIALYRNNDGALIGGDIWDGAEMLCVYNSTTTAFQCIGTSSNSLFAYVTNADSVAITKGQPVYAFGGTGDRLTVKRAFNTSDATSAQTVGVVLTSSIAVNQKGIIIIQGLLDGLSILPTSTWADGDPVYLGTTAGSITNVKQYAPNHLVYLGTVTTASNGSAGRWYVRVQNGYELDELHNVQAQSPSLKDTLWYDSGVTPGQWKTASIPTILGYTPFNLPSLTNGSVIFSNGTTLTQDNANFFWDDTNNRLGIGTSSPQASLHVSGNMYLQNPSGIDTITFSNGPQIQANGPSGYFKSGQVYTNTLSNFVGIATSSPTTELDVNGVITATGGNSTSWNAKQDAITLTTTGTSGPATLVGSTLNIPQYSGGGGGSTPVKLTSQTLTAASWTLVGGYYTYAFSDVNVTTTCDVSVTPQNSSYLTAYNAQVLPFVGVAAGVATFYSQFPPQADMVVDIVITQTT